MENYLNKAYEEMLTIYLDAQLDLEHSENDLDKVRARENLNVMKKRVNIFVKIVVEFTYRSYDLLFKTDLLLEKNNNEQCENLTKLKKEYADIQKELIKFRKENKK